MYTSHVNKQLLTYLLKKWQLYTIIKKQLAPCSLLTQYLNTYNTFVLQILALSQTRLTCSKPPIHTV